MERQKKIRSESRGIESLDAQPPKPPRQLGELREESLEQAVSRAGEEEDIRDRLFSNEEMENVDIVRADFYGRPSAPHNGQTVPAPVRVARPVPFFSPPAGSVPGKGSPPAGKAALRR